MTEDPRVKNAVSLSLMTKDYCSSAVINGMNYDRQAQLLTQRSLPLGVLLSVFIQ